RSCLACASSRPGSNAQRWPGTRSITRSRKPGIRLALNKRRSMSYTRQDVIVSRDCPAVTVPYGSPVTIEKGCEATITQQLGGSYTVIVEGNLYRIEGEDGDALGFEPTEATRHVPEGPITAQSIEDAAWALLSPCSDHKIYVHIIHLRLEYSCKVLTSEEEQYDIEVQ